MFTDVLPECMSWCWRILEETVRSSGTRVTDGYELLHEWLELNPGPLQEQSVLLTAEASLQPLWLP